MASTGEPRAAQGQHRDLGDDDSKSGAVSSSGNGDQDSHHEHTPRSSSPSVTTVSPDTGSSAASNPLDTPASSVCSLLTHCDCEHEFGDDRGSWVDKGGYGHVYRVHCLKCQQTLARKDIEVLEFDSEKHRQSIDIELNCYKVMNHAHILGYRGHTASRDEKLLQIYTEFCDEGDLNKYLSRSKRMISDFFSWHVVQGLASALSRCHHGFQTATLPDQSYEYSGLETPWKTVLHRDIKPHNILLARRTSPMAADERRFYGWDTIVKLGDFGTSFLYEDDKKNPVTRHAGTEAFWPPEILKESLQGNGSIKSWSTKSDIWGMGAVLHYCSVLKIPSREQSDNLVERIAEIRKSLNAVNNTSAPDALIQLIGECLSPTPQNRPSAPQILAVALKGNTSAEGLRKSESFWRVVADICQDETSPYKGSDIVEYFVNKYLRMIHDATFSVKEACLIMSLAMLSGCGQITCAFSLCRNFQGNLEGGTVWHALASLPESETKIARLCWDVARWQDSKPLASQVLSKNKAGLLPSALAAYCGNLELAKRLSELEDAVRQSDAALSTQLAVDQACKTLEKKGVDEFDFLFKLFTINGVPDYYSKVARTEVGRALVVAAEEGYHNVVKKLVMLGISASAVRGSRRLTALHHYAMVGNVTMVTFLLDNGALVNARDSTRQTPLHWAALAGQTDAARLLLSKGAEVNAEDHLHRTALFDAASKGHTDLVRLLVGRGARPSIRGGQHQLTALERARRSNHEEIVKLLEAHQS